MVKIQWGLALVLLAGALPIAEATSRGGPPLTSGGDFPGEYSCTRCHTGSEVNAGQGTLKLLIGDSSAGGQSYTPGETVALTVSFADVNAAVVGFQLTARSGDGCGPAGTLTTASSPNGSSIKVVEGDCGGGSGTVQWATHELPRNGSAADFEVSWTAPPESVGPVTIAAAVNGADGMRNSDGDRIYTAQAVLQPLVEPAGPPMISDAGVTLLGDSAEAITEGAPGAIAIVNGMDFAASGSETFGTVDENGDLSTVVGGVCVEVGQTRAPILHVAAERIHVQVPVDAELGPVSVEVIRGCDPPADGPQPVRSNSATFMIVDVLPAFLQFSQAVPGVAALHQDFAVVAATDAFVPEKGPSSRPAAPGDVVTLYGTGFGLTDPPLPNGDLSGFTRSLAAESVKAMVGDFEVSPEDFDIVYAGVSPEIAGFYQVSVRIPEAVSSGDHAFSLILDHKMSSPGPVLPTVVVPPPPPPPDDGGSQPPEAEEEEVQACKIDLVIAPGESCAGSILGIEGIFEVPDSGEEKGMGCIDAPSIDLRRCEEEKQSLLGLVEVEKGDDGKWTITKFPETP